MATQTANTEGLQAAGDILLDAGTNELEALVFGLAGQWYGVNVAKVREVILPIPTTKSPHRHASVIGVFNIRGDLAPLVDLRGHLDLGERLTADPENGRVIVTEFNGQRVGFHVDSVDQIRRVSWGEVKPAPQVHNQNMGIITGVLELGEKLILMLDFESIADTINEQEKLHVEFVENELGVDRGSQRVVFAEDSPFMRRRIHEVFTKSGYTGIEICDDGQAGWELISRTHEERPINAIVSDIEMPRMDGLHLAKRIKETPSLANIPLMLFSSLVSQDNLKKGEQVGADMQIPKPNLPELVRLVDKLVAGALDGTADNPANIGEVRI